MFEALHFPLNAYALAIELQEGRVEDLHYGLYDDPAATLFDAQAHHPRYLLEPFPPPPARVLEVGFGLGGTFKTIAHRGYELDGVTPDPAQIARLAPNTSLFQSRFEDLPPNA